MSKLRWVNILFIAKIPDFYETGTLILQHFRICITFDSGKDDMAAKKEQLVEHPGVVERIEAGRLFVRIESRSACGNCHSRSYCGMSEMQEKIVEVDNKSQTEYHTGQRVNVVLEESLGYKALLLAYLIPFVILLGGIILILSITGNEPLAALTGLGLMLPYYFWLYYSRDKLRKTFHFRIRQI